MRAAFFLSLLVALGPVLAQAQSASDRAWQQRLQIEVPLPVPLVELEAVNPFVTPFDEPPAILSSSSPRKVDVRGVAVVAAFVDSKGDCLGGVPLELPFPGLTTAVIEGLAGARFDPAMAGTAPQSSWTVLELGMEGRVKEAQVSEQSLEPPDPAAPPARTTPLEMAPPGRLRSLDFTPQDQLTQLAVPRRVSVKAPRRDDQVPMRALVHFTPEGRCDRFVPLELYPGLERWFSAFLATWKVQPASRDGEPVDSWSVYSAMVAIEMSGIDSEDVRVVRDRQYHPPE